MNKIIKGITVVFILEYHYEILNSQEMWYLSICAEDVEKTTFAIVMILSSLLRAMAHKVRVKASFRGRCRVVPCVGSDIEYVLSRTLHNKGWCFLIFNI